MTCFTSCTIEKRLYRPGFHIHDSKNNSIESRSIKGGDEEKPIDRVEPIGFTASTSHILESNPGFTMPILMSAAVNRLITLTVDSCDNIILKKGIEVRGRIVEINPTEIRYKKCDNLNGPTIVISKQDVFMIQYINGTMDSFVEDSSEEKPVKEKPKADNPKKFQALGLIGSLLTFIIGGILLAAIPSIGAFGAGLVLGFLGMVFGSIAVTRINRKPDERSGMFFAILSLIGGLLLFILSIVLLFVL